MDSEQGNLLEEGRVGEVLLRGPIAMTNYLDNIAATTAAFDSQGWLRTGDIGYIDVSGKLYIIDRKKVSHPPYPSLPKNRKKTRLMLYQGSNQSPRLASRTRRTGKHTSSSPGHR